MLVWAHGEYLKLYAARASRRPVELLAALEARYRQKAVEAATWFWRDQAPFSRLPAGRHLVVEAAAPFTLHVGLGGWEEISDRDSEPLGLGRYGVRLDRDELAARGSVEFTGRFESGYEGRDWRVELA